MVWTEEVDEMKRVSLWLGFFVGFAVSALAVGILSGYLLNQFEPSNNSRKPASQEPELSPAPDPLPRLYHVQ